MLIAAVVCVSISALAASGAGEGPARWEWAGWGGGGFFWSCVWHPTDPRILHLGGDVGGVYRSDDGGASWRFANAGLANYAAYSMAISCVNPQTLYVMTRNGICRTSDGARTWKHLDQTLKGKLDISAHRPGSVRPIAVDPTDAEVVYAGSHDGRLFKSEDGGATWRKLDYTAALDAASRIAPPPAFSGSGYLVLAYASKEGDWNRNGRIERSFWPTSTNWSPYGRMTASARIQPGAPKVEAQLVVQTGEKWLWHAGPWAELKPDTWIELSLDLAELKDMQAVRAAYVVIRTPQAGYTGEVYVDALSLHKTDGGKIVFADWEKPGETDGWRPNRKIADALFVTDARHSSDSRSREKGVISAVSPAQSDARLVFVANSELGVFRSADAGATWIHLKTPRNATCVAVSPRDANLVYASFGENGVRRSGDRGETWVEACAGLTERCAIREVAPHPQDTARVFCIGNVGWKGFFYFSRDQGRRWECSRLMKLDPAASPTLPDETGGGELSPGTADMSRLSNLAFCPAKPDLLFLAGNWRNCLSADGGLTWTECVRGADITCVEDIQFHAGTVYVTAMDEGILMSRDNGATWRQLCPRKYEEGLSGHQWRVKAWRQGNADAVLATVSPWAGKEEYPNAALLSEDGGATFRKITQGLPSYVPKKNCMWGQGYARALAQDPANPQTLYLGIDGDPEPDKGHSGGGVFASRDGGRTWAQLPGQPGSRRMFFGLAVDPTDSSRLFWGACGDGGGVWRSPDAGKTWQRAFADETWVFNVMVSPSGSVYCGSANLWRSDDHGVTWRNLTRFPAGEPVVVGIETDPADENRIWISRVTWGEDARGGVYSTTDAGKTWQDISGDLPYRKPIVLRYNPTRRELWAGGVGLFRALQ